MMEFRRGGDLSHQDKVGYYFLCLCHLKHALQEKKDY